MILFQFISYKRVYFSYNTSFTNWIVITSTSIICYNYFSYPCFYFFFPLFTGTDIVLVKLLFLLLLLLVLLLLLLLVELSLLLFVIYIFSSNVRPGGCLYKQFLVQQLIPF